MSPAGGADLLVQDSDLVLDPRGLHDDPRIEHAMVKAGFYLNPVSGQPGAWLSHQGIPVDLMVPEALAGAPGRRGARIPPHAKDAARRSAGLEATVVDHAPRVITSLSADDERRFTANVAGPAALLVAKLHKVGERLNTPHRLNDKDAHDIYRLLVAIPTEDLASSLIRLRSDPLSGPTTARALEYLEVMFAAGATARGSLMAGRAEEGVGEPETVSGAAAVLSSDLLTSLSNAG